MEGKQRSHHGARHFPWLRAFIALLVSLLVSAAAILLILSTEHVIAAYWLVIIPVALAALGQLIPLYQYLFPISTETKPDLLSPTTPIEVKVTLSPPATEPGRNDKNRLPEAPKLLWNIPYPRNLFFTGRESILEELHQRLATHQTTALTQRQAISGLGGIGKTQIAIEYAYRHHTTGDYRAMLWVKADTRESILASFQEIATLLDLPAKDETDLTKVAAAVKRWLVEHDDWLLIFDNADELTLVEDFLPPSESGMLLLTTRNQAPGVLANPIDIAQMDRAEGTLLLLRRAGRLPWNAQLEQTSPNERILAEQIVQQLDGLPLAIDQAAAYLEETRSSLASYLTAYQHRRISLLQERGSDPYKHLPVTTTWTLNFEQVEQAASDLLHVLAFLAPDAIPEDLLFAGASELGPSLKSIATDETLLDLAMRSLLRFSLVQRNPGLHQLSIHRLVQEIFRSRMSDETRQAWAERTVRAVNKALPDGDFFTWPQCERYLPHALACAALVESFSLGFAEAASLLNQTAFYLRQRAQYPDAEPLIKRALAIDEQAQGPNHPVTASSLSNLALLYNEQGRFKEAEPLYQRALAIYEQALGPDHLKTAAALNNLAALYDEQGRYKEAEPLYQRSLAISEQALGPNHPNIAACYNNLADLYTSQRRYKEAEPLIKRALAIDEQAQGLNHPNVAGDLNNLALIYQHQGRYKEAEPLYQRALAINEQVLGLNHPKTAASLHNLASLYTGQRRYKEAEPLIKRALVINEQVLGSMHPHTIAGRISYMALLESMHPKALAGCFNYMDLFEMMKRKKRP